MDDNMEERVGVELTRTAKLHVSVIAIDTSDMPLEEAARTVEDAITDKIRELGRLANVIGINVIPASQQYTLPGESSSDRDYTYSDTGFLGILTYREK